MSRQGQAASEPAPALRETPGRTASTTVLGCLAYLAVLAVLAAAIDRWAAARVVPELRPWLGIASALCFTLALGSAWTFLSGLFDRGGSRAAVLERAAAGTLPAEDGVALVTGTVRAAGVPLQAPLSGTPCAAYTYRMFRTSRNNKGSLDEIPVYWGLASRPFILDGRARAVRVMAVPWIVDDAVRHSGADAVARARRYVAATRFDEKSGLLGVTASAFGTMRVLFDDEDGEHRSDCRNTGAAQGLEGLLLEETVLPMGATASVAGTWSASRGAIVSGGAAAGGVTATVGPVENLLRGSSVVPPSLTNAAVFALLFAGLGWGLLWAAIKWMAPGSDLIAR